MKRLWSFVSDEDDPFGPGTDLIISLLAVLLILLVITANSYRDQNLKYQQSRESLDFYRNRVEELDGLLKEEQAKNSSLYEKLLTESANKKSQFPPNIIMALLGLRGIMYNNIRL